jgi:hypothetical protein
MKTLHYVALATMLIGVLSLVHSAVAQKLTEIGKVNMISNRNIDPSGNYKMIKSYSSDTKSEIKHLKLITIEQAIDHVVKKVPGGEYLMNVKIFIYHEKYFVVEGDVWGLENAEITQKGFKAGDSVTWKKSGKFVKGKITALRDDKTCLIEDESGKIIEMKYENVIKAE